MFWKTKEFDPTFPGRRIYPRSEGNVGCIGKDAKRGIFGSGQRQDQADLEAVTKKNGFKNFAEYEALAANIKSEALGA